MKQILLRAAAAALLIAISSCEYRNPMTVYDGLDFLEAHDLTEWTETSPGTMNYQTVDATAAGNFDGLPGGGADSHRLEVPNLFPNGDFENGSDPPTGWTTVSSAVRSLSTTDQINGNSLMYDTVVNDGLVQYDFSSQLSGNGVYRIILNIMEQAGNENPGFLQLVSDPAGTPKTLENLFSAGSLEENISQDISITNGNGVFIIGDDSGEAQPQAGYIDDIRMGRTNLDQYITFDVPYQETAGLPLVSGAYRFSVWVKVEIDSQVTPNVPNRYRASGIVLEIDDDITDTASGTEEEIYLTVPDQWTRISVTKEDVVIVNAPLPGDADPMIRLRISPITTYSGGGSMPLGSLLIAEPTLELSY